MNESGERIKAVEISQSLMREDLERFRKHIGDLLNFKSSLEGSMTTMKWILGFLGISNVAVLLKMLAQ
jgi:hypothetical protein